jgi:NAD(P)-dependent dehydrogenase (short-subunit alcohol dehydrogenase family)
MDIQSLFNLNGRVAVVTGGSRGIGKMIVEGYLKAGAARVYISARKVDQIEETVAEFGSQVIGLPCDLSTVDGCLSLAEQIAAREEKVDILVNNAGAAWGAEFGQFPESGWDRVMDLNVKSLFFLTQALHPQLKAAASFDRPGKVINIASIDGLRINAERLGRQLTKRRFGMRRRCPVFFRFERGIRCAANLYRQSGQGQFQF